MADVHAEGAMDALYDFLNDGSDGLNTVLASIRTEKTLTTANLPNVAILEKWYHRAAQATKTPYLSLHVDSLTADDENNSRFYDVEFDATLVVYDSDISGDEVAVMLAAWRYAEAIERILRRRTPMTRQGWTLNGGASGRIIRAELRTQRVGEDPGLAQPNIALISRIAVRIAEDY